VNYAVEGAEFSQVSDHCVALAGFLGQDEAKAHSCLFCVPISGIGLEDFEEKQSLGWRVLTRKMPSPQLRPRAPGLGADLDKDTAWPLDRLSSIRLPSRPHPLPLPLPKSICCPSYLLQQTQDPTWLNVRILHSNPTRTDRTPLGRLPQISPSSTSLSYHPLPHTLPLLWARKPRAIRTSPITPLATLPLYLKVLARRSSAIRPLVRPRRRDPSTRNHSFGFSLLSLSL
jgi:hypothetical protein